ncbi:MAG: hypothetical protein ACC630_07955, partial [Nitrospinota bacterium]
TLSYYPLYLAMDLNHLPLVSLVILVVIICIFITIPTPGFIGPYNAACAVGLHDIYKVSESVAAGFGIVAWSANAGIIIVLGLFFILKDNIALKEIQGVVH